MKTLSQNRLVLIGQILLIMGASYYLLVYFVLALTRLSYPFELEWMEGGSVIQVQRILDGQSLYVRPSLDFVPFIYTPLYFYISSLFAQITENGFLPLRLVSLLSSLGCLVLIYMIVYRRTASCYASFMASCLFAATFRISGAWFDIARVDSLFLFLLLAGIYTFDAPGRFTRSFAAAILLFLSFFTKQTALTTATCLLVAALCTRRQTERYLFPLSFGFLMLASFLIMNTSTAGWYQYYVFDLPVQHNVATAMLVKFWTHDIAQPLPIAVCISLVPFFSLATTKSKANSIIRDMFILGGLLLTSYFSRLHAGAYVNVLMPAYAGLSIYFGIGLHRLLKITGQLSSIKIIVILVVAFQFYALFYPPGQQIPSARDKQQGQKLEALILSFEGEVYLADHPWYLGTLNKPTQAQYMAIIDIFRASESEQWQETLVQELTTAVVERRYEAFIIDSKEFVMQVPNFENYYELVESNLSRNAFHPVTGVNRRPTYLYVRRTVQSDSATDTDKQNR
ncbi:MAG: glycosyltransferase family 39 protein [Anaerolineae bacterium]|nr:glycosyltransferase family 39 protein [Anaerolineae bacterium]